LQIKEKMGMKKELVVVVIVVLFTGIALSGCVNESENEIKKTMTYAELLSDIEIVPGTDYPTFKTYNDSEVIYIEDTVYNMTYYNFSESEKYTFLSFGPGDIPLCINGDKRIEYAVGNAVSIPVHVKDYVLNETAVTILEEWYFLYSMGAFQN
jgi:hypothetical protein